MANFISEDQIEKAIIEVFKNNLGYRHLNCLTKDLTDRSGEHEVVLKTILKNQLHKLNKFVPETAIESAYETLTKINTTTTAINANREFYNYIKNGIPVTISNKKDKEEPVNIKVIDFEDETQNDYLVVSQLWIKGQFFRWRPDLIIFINGLPLIFIELKNSIVDIRNAYDDNLTKYKSDIPALFQYNALCILSNGLETKVGSSFSGYEHFFKWLRVDDEKKVPDTEKIKQFGVSLDYAVLGLCHKKNILDYFEHFIFYYKDSVKICAKNHQFLGVNNIIANFEKRLIHDKAKTDESNKGKLGVFWHTQGSGKSFSMIFFTRKIFRKFTGNYTFLIVTDRDDLDGQIYRNFLGAGAFPKTEQCRPKNSEDLREMLKTNRRYIFTLIQKFRYDKSKNYPLLSERNDIIVIIDEAHRTQYKDLAENLRIGLKNAQYIAFTGTPLLGSRQLTKEWFGSTVSEYDFKQSIDDGATVPLFYHKRVPEVLLQNDTLNNDFAEIIQDENLTQEQEEKLEREFGQELSILRSDDRLDKIAKDIAYHFPRRGYLGKGMVISVDKFTVVKMYNKVQQFWKEEIKNLNTEINKSKEENEKTELTRIRDWMRKTEMAVIVSEEAGEEDKFKKANLDIKPHRDKMNDVDENGFELEDKFKDPKDPLQLVFVCSMWLTGFDAPTVSTLYLDKPMKDHTLMQTIARANRVTDHLTFNKPKKNGLIVDYYNVFRNLRKAFASYGAGSDKTSTENNNGDGDGLENPVKDNKELYVLLKSAVDECVNWSATLGIDLLEIEKSNMVFKNLEAFDLYADILMTNDTDKKQFSVYDNTIDALYEACKPEIIHRKNEFKLVAVIHYLRNVIEGKVDRGNLDNAKRRISALLDESILAQKELEDKQNKENATNIPDPVLADKKEFFFTAWKTLDLSKLNIDKLREQFKDAVYKNIEISDLREFISSKLQLLLEKNTTRTGFAEKLQEIIDRYNSGGSETENYFADLIDFVDKLKDEEQRHIREGLTEDELELFDLLKKEKLTKDEGIKVKLAAKTLLTRLKEEKPTVLINDWHKDTVTKLHVQSAIKNVLDKFLPETYEKEIFNEKCNLVFDHYIQMAAQGNQKAFVA